MTTYQQPTSRWRRPAAAVAFGLIVAAVATGCGTETEQSAPPAASSSEVVVTSTPATPVATTSPRTATSTENPEGRQTEDSEPFVPLSAAHDGSAAKRVATAFITATLDTEKSREQWSKDLAPYATTQFAAELALTDPGDIPVQHVTGAARVTAVSMTGTQMTLVVPTSGQGYTVLAARDGMQIKVTHAEPGMSTSTATPSAK
ncbi:hypothetical protein PZ938_00225 [Luteipulveratus sp. YIM 133132]|uniref:hypothetical protein n=1 Tax=Luteipulveratus flavus TaxID=3031728 RepID=UPI0023B1AE50|nr:hypothetical protein [Luteipulveratus sp. YIM 133132]MDE9364020.1 hypothetical protein [Luteipulveratus sp. YIM 133132]